MVIDKVSKLYMVVRECQLKCLLEEIEPYISKKNFDFYSIVIKNVYLLKTNKYSFHKYITFLMKKLLTLYNENIKKR